MKALVLIDIQNDYFQGGRKELVASEQAGEKAGVLLSAFRKKELPIFHVQHISTRPTATFFLPDTEGVLIHKSVAPMAGEIIVQKHYPNSFRETILLEELKKASVTELVIAGMMTHMCVDTTVRAAADLGFTTMLAHDACATCALSFAGKEVTANHVQTAFMAAIHGLFAEVVATETLCTRI